MLGTQANLYQLMMRSEGIELNKMVLENNSLEDFANLESISCGGFNIVIPNEKQLLEDLIFFGYPKKDIPIANPDDTGWLNEASVFNKITGLLQVTTKYLSTSILKKILESISMKDRDREIHRLAVIIAFRVKDDEVNIERCNHLRLVISYLKIFLQNIPHRIFVFSINDDFENWNKGLIFNTAVHVIPKHYDYFIFHDVDELPLNETNSYQYNEYPIHRARSSSRLNYNNQKVSTTALMQIFQMTRTMYEEVNGYSNAYWGWGAEDDDIKGGKSNPNCLIPPAKHAMTFSLPHRRDHSLSGETKKRLESNREYLFDHMNEKTRKNEGFSTTKYAIVDEQHSSSYSKYIIKFLLSKKETRND